ncbi:protein translocase subunit SecD [Leekyejoonella antrihumi]|uniref:protein translocase subunit SecD n=1 Tax=Leekyejoonella antrihumi TaxID=1660198 RepID=UPI001FE9DE1E|nr:protein translocase subunit SecD [Leekyejoonella antrihumi]
MATRARRSSTGHPRRALVILVLIFAALYAGIGATAAWGSPHGQWTPKLGLDLEGGRQITLQAQLPKGKSINSGQVNQAVDIIRQRVDGSGVSEADVSTLGSDNIVVALPGDPSEATLRSLAQSSQLAFRAVLKTAAIQPQATTPQTQPTLPMPQTAPATPKPTTAPSSSTAGPSKSATPKSTKSGANAAFPQAFAAGTAKATETAAAANKPKNASDLAWATQPVSQTWITNGLAKKGETYQSLFTAYSCNNTDAKAGPTAQQWREVAAQAPLNEPDVGCDAQAKYLMGPSEVNGAMVTNATWGQVSNSQGTQTGEIAVNLTFNGKGTTAFANVTQRLVALKGDQNRFAITVDGNIISAPTTQAAITNGQAQITGNFTQASAKSLSNQLKFGALPFSFKELTSDQISPQVGADQLQKGMIAGAIGLLLVVIYSLLQYRALGFVTVFSLLISGSLTYGAVTFLGYANNFRLSMAGVTGLIVAIGVTADSFIVYFERVRDEVRSGRPLGAAVQTGWARAKRTIIISDAVNFLSAAVLYFLSTSDVKAFAFTLGLTTVLDVLVVMTFTHPVLTLLARTEFFGNGHRWSGFDPERLGAKGVTYAGRGRVTIADRKAAEGAQI